MRIYFIDIVNHDVECFEIGFQSFEQLDGLGAILGFSENLATEVLEVMPNDISDKDGVIGDENSYSHPRVSCFKLLASLNLSQPGRAGTPAPTIGRWESPASSNRPP